MQLFVKLPQSFAVGLRRGRACLALLAGGNLVALYEQDERQGRGTVAANGTHLQIDLARGAVEVDGDRQRQSVPSLIERAVQGGAKLHSEFEPRDLGDVAGHGPAGMLDITPRALREMHYSIVFVDESAGRRGIL